MDALVGFAIAALALTVILTVLPNNAARQSERLQRYQAMEFAYSVLEEYRVTYPQMRLEGETHSGWSWAVKETGAPPNRELASPLIKYVDVTVTTWNRNRPDLQATLQGTIARRNE